MALVNPDIAMSFRQPEFKPRNAMAEYAQMQQIQGGQQAQELARFQLGAAKRAESVQNALTDAYASSLNEKGEVDYNKLLPALAQRGGGSQIPSILKARAETEAARLTQEKTRGEIDKNTFDLQDKRLKAAWDLIGSSTSPQKAIAEFNKGVKSGVFKAEEVAEDLQLLGSMTKPEEFNAYLNDAIAKTLDAKGKLAQRAVTTKDTDRGGYIERQTYNAQGTPIGTPTRLDKTATIGETTAQQQLGVSQGQLRVAQQRLAQDAQGVTYQQDAQGNLMALPSRLPAGGAPVARPVTGESGAPIKGKGSKELAVSEQQASYNLGRILDAAKEIDAAVKKDPNALKPGMGEAAAASVGLSGTANVARNAQRQIVYGAQRDALDAMLYLATGAAYNKEQLEGQMAAYVPAFTDKSDAVEAKRTRMLGLIQNAKVRAGKAWTPEMDAASQVLFQPIVSGGKPAAGGATGNWSVVR